ncbi:PilN domain-containing protein [Krasilnikovia sp. MM14-A1004]|uniref:PilN domain-containing protein n=1 Tax=Krasilnikovia sp. MM14-A1004 TaxID=3373541 RepID=UPI00399D44AA
MSTTLMPVDPQTSPLRATRLLTITANLMPEEIVAARRAKRARSAVIGALVGVGVLLGGWFMHAQHQTRTAEQERDDVQAQVVDQRHKQQKYDEVVNVQAQTTTIVGQLKTVMATDLPYATLLDTVRQTGVSADVTVTGVTAKLDDAASADSAGTTPAKSDTVGTLQITGDAKDKNAVARYVDLLGKVPTVVNPFVTSVAESKDEAGAKKVEFSLNAEISGTAKCGRFTTPCKSTGGN